MISILDRHIGKSLLCNILLTLSTLLAIFFFFGLVDALGRTSPEGYGALQAIAYTLLTIPGLLYELIPIACIIGGMTSIGLLVNNHSLIVMYTAGISPLRLALSLIKTGLILVVFSTLIADQVVPLTEQKAKEIRYLTNNKLALPTSDGLWLRNQDDFIKIKHLLPGNKINDITIYRFNEAKLLNITRADHGEYHDGAWQLREITQTHIDQDAIRTTQHAHMRWGELIDPEFIGFITIDPRYLSFKNLIYYINHLKMNGQNATAYQQGLWAKIIMPFSILAMLLLALPLVRPGSRTVPIGQRIAIGVLIGVVIHFANQFFTNVGIIYGLMSPALSAVLPTLLLLTGIACFLKKNH